MLDPESEINLMQAETASWIRQPHKLRKLVHARAHADPLPPVAVNKQRRRSLWLLITTLIRAAFWLVLLGCVALGLAHVAGFAWAHNLSETVWFVALLSLYANLATDLGASIAAYAALISADVHSQISAARIELAADLAGLEEDIAQLADLPPGPEATVLRDSIKTRLTVHKNGVKT